MLVQSEDEPDTTLLETRICKEDSFQKQQGTMPYVYSVCKVETDTISLDTLIVWTEPTTSIDMALSFQEGEGCASIWLVEISPQ